jgi:formylglycine-generating enzyme required for sulfatase activity
MRPVLQAGTQFWLLFAAALLLSSTAPLLGDSQLAEGARTKARRPVQPGVANPVGIEWKRIPAGSFMMGCTDGDLACLDAERPVHRVSIRSFELAATETTVRQYLQCVGAGECRPAGIGEGDHPVVQVDWHQARAFCAWAGGRLPTESEWEYAARGGRDGSRYPWGSSISHENANLDSDTFGALSNGRDRWQQTSPAKSFAANAFGLYDISGNVWEWVEDVWHDDYSGAPSDGSAWISGGDPAFRVLRGGSWVNDADELRVSNRNGMSHGYRCVDDGFRCARSLSTP